MNTIGDIFAERTDWDFLKKFEKKVEKFKKILSGKNFVFINPSHIGQRTPFELSVSPSLILEQGVAIMHTKGIFPKITYTAHNPEVLVTIQEIMKQRTQISRLHQEKNPSSKNIEKANQISKELALNIGVMISHLFSPNNKKNGDEPIAIALDPNNNFPCILFTSVINEKTKEIPAAVKKYVTKRHLLKEEQLEVALQRALGVREKILAIEKILSDIR